MNAIYKYELEITDRQGLELPLGSEILSVKNQYGCLCLWALVDPYQDKTTLWEIEIIGTGHPIYTDEKTFREFIDTVVMPDGLVCHVFKRIS